LFGNRREAANALRRIAEAYQLCPIILGLEKTAQPGRPCFSYQVHQCKGACIGRESLGLHSARLMTALAKLKLQAWPYDGPVGLVERDDFLDIEEMHVIDNWRYLGTATSEEEVHELLAKTASVPFDRDTYRLIQARLGKGKLTVRRL
jgi:DNA polymerase-3 subunit epsilon